MCKRLSCCHLGNAVYKVAVSASDFHEEAGLPTDVLAVAEAGLPLLVAVQAVLVPSLTNLCLSCGFDVCLSECFW